MMEKVTEVIVNKRRKRTVTQKNAKAERAIRRVDRERKAKVAGKECGA